MKAENRASDGDVNLFIDNPLDFSMPPAIAFHPRMHKTRVDFLRDAINSCAFSSSARPLSGGFDYEPVLDIVRNEDELLRKQKELEGEEKKIALELQSAIEENSSNVTAIRAEL